MAARRYVLEKGSHGVRELRQQIGVRRRLRGVRIEVAVGYIEKSRAKAGIDQLGGQLEAAGEWRVWRGRLGLVILADFLQATAAGVSVRRRTLHEIEQSRSAVGLGRALDEVALLLLVGTARSGELQLKLLQRLDRWNPGWRSVQGQRRRLIV